MGMRAGTRVLCFVLAIGMFLQPVASIGKEPGTDRRSLIELPAAPSLAFASLAAETSAQQVLTDTQVKTAQATAAAAKRRAVQVESSARTTSRTRYSEIDLTSLLKKLNLQMKDVENTTQDLQDQADAINEKSVLVMFRTGTTQAAALSVLSACGMTSLGAFGTSGLYLAVPKSGVGLESAIVKLQARPEVIAADSLSSAINHSDSPATDSNADADAESAPSGTDSGGAATETDTEATAGVGDATDTTATSGDTADATGTGGDAATGTGDAAAAGTGDAGATDGVVVAAPTAIEDPSTGTAGEPEASAPADAPAAAAPEQAACPDGIDPSGTVRDKDSLRLLHNALVRVMNSASGEAKEAYTNSEGFYSVLVPDGEYLISAMVPGYATQSVTRVVAGEPITVDFDLADVTAPRFVANSGKPGTTGAVGALPLVGAVFYDSESGVDGVAGATLLVDGVDVSADAVLSPLSIKYRPKAPLAAGAHTVALTVRDRAGNAASSDWSFSVVVSTAGDGSAEDFVAGSASNVVPDGAGGLCLALVEALSPGDRARGVTYVRSADPLADPDAGDAEFTDDDDSTLLGYDVAPLDTATVDITLDLGVVKRLGKASLATGDGTPVFAADLFEVLVSLDGVEFTPLGSTSLLEGNAMSVGFAPVEARYVRFRATKSAGDLAAVLQLNDGRLFEALQVYAAGGWFESRAIDTGAPSDLYTVDWGPLSQAPGTEIKLQVAGLDTAGESPGWMGPDGTPGTYFVATSTKKLPAVLSGKRYLRYRVLMTTVDPEQTPKLSRVEFTYDNRGPPPVDDVTVTLSSPAEGALLEGDAIAVAGSASDADGVLGVFVSDNGGQSWRLSDTTDDFATWTTSIASNHGGTYGITATAVGSDYERPAADASATVIAVPDTTSYSWATPGDPEIHGTVGNDDLRLEYDGTHVKIYRGGVLDVTLTPDAGDPVFGVFGEEGNDTITLVSTATLPVPFKVVVYGGNGNDRLDASDFASDLVTELRGGLGDDTYVYDEDFGFGNNFQIFESADQGSDTITFVGYAGVATVTAGASSVTLERTSPARSLVLSSALMSNLERLTAIDLELDPTVLDALTGSVLDDMVSWAANLLANAAVSSSYLNRVLPMLLGNVGVSIGNALDLAGLAEAFRTYIRSIIRNNLPVTEPPSNPSLSEVVSAINTAFAAAKTIARYGAGVVSDRILTGTLLDDLDGVGADSMSFTVAGTWIPDQANPSATAPFSATISISLDGASLANIAARIQEQLNNAAANSEMSIGGLVRAVLSDNALVIDANNRSVTALRVTPSGANAEAVFGFVGQRIAQLANRIDFPDAPGAADDRLNQLILDIAASPYLHFVGGGLAIGLALGLSGTASTQFAIDLGSTFREMRGIIFDVNAKMRFDVAYGADFVLSAVLGELFTNGRLTISNLDLTGSVVPAANVSMSVGFLGATATFAGSLSAHARWTPSGDPLVIAAGSTTLASQIARIAAGTSVNMTVTVTPSGGLAGLAGLPSATMTLSGADKDPFDPATYAFSNWVLSSSMTDLLPFNEISATGVVSMLRSLGSTIQRLVNLEIAGYKIPFAGKGLEEIMKFADTIADYIIGGDGINKLLDSEGSLTFKTAQTLMQVLSTLGVSAAGSYSQTTKELVYTINLGSVPFTLLNLPIDFHLDLGSIANIQSTTKVRIDSWFGLQIAFGFDLDPTAGGEMTLATAISSLKKPPAYNTRPAVTGGGSVPAYYGRLSGNADFKITVEGVTTHEYNVTLTRAATKAITDTTPATLVTLLAAALATAGVPAADVAVQAYDFDPGTTAKEWRLKLLAGPGVTNISVSAANGSVFMNELGLPFSASGSTIVGTSNLSPTVGRLASEVAFTVTLTGASPVGGKTLTLTLTEDATKGNRSTADLVFDLKEALKTALGPSGIFTAEELATLSVDTFLLVSTQAGAAGSSGERLVLTAKDVRITDFVVGGLTATERTELGFADSTLYPLDAYVADFIIRPSDGSGPYVVSLNGLPADPTINHLKSLIESATSSKVRVWLTPPGGEADNKPLWDGKRLILEDTTFVNPATGSMFRIETLNASTAAFDLGILARDATSDAERNGIVEGSTIYGLGATDRFFIRGIGGAAPHLSTSLKLWLPAGLNATARIGFVTVKLTSVDQNNDAFEIGASLDIDDPNDDGKITLTEMLAALSNAASTGTLPDLLSAIAFDSIDANDRLRINVEVTPSFGDFQLVDPTKYLTFALGTSAGNLNVSMLGMAALGDINEFLRSVTVDGVVKSFGFSEIISGLRMLTGLLNSLEGFGFLNTDIPLVGKSINDIVSLAGQFATALNSLSSDPASSLQLLQNVVRDALGVSFPFDPLGLSLVSGGTGGAKILKLDLKFSQTINKAASLALPNLTIPGLGDAISLTGGAGLNLSASLEGRLVLGLDLGIPFGGVYLYDSTYLKGTFGASGSNLSFTANLGPISLGVVNGSANITALAMITFTGGAPFTGGKVLLAPATLAQTLIDLVGDMHPAVSGSITASLPLTLSGFSLGSVAVTMTDIANPSTLVITLPAKLLDGSFIDDMLQSINFLDALTLLPNGIDAFLDMLQGILSSDVLSTKLPFIGDQMAKAVNFIDDVRRKFVIPLTELIDSIKNAAADFDKQDKNLVSIQIFKLLGPAGLDLIKDRNDSGAVDINDIALSTNLPSPPSFGEAYAQWLMEIGDSYTIGTGINFDIGIPGFGLETTGAISLTVEWSLVLGFGISGEKGIYLVVDPDREELALDVSFNMNDVSIAGTLAFLQLKAQVVDPPGKHTDFGVTFAVNLGIDGDPNATQVGLGDLGSLKLSPRLAAVANAYLFLTLGLDPDLGSFASGFPKIVADFIFEFGYGTRGVGTTLDDHLTGTGANLLNLTGDTNTLWGGATAGTGGLHKVALENIGLDLGTFLSKVIKPVVDKINEAIEPFMPIIEVATTPIPVISDLAGEPVTLLTLAGFFGSFDAGMIESIADLLKIVNQIANLPGDELIIYFGDWEIYSTNPGNLPNLWDPGADKAAIGASAPTAPSFASALGDALGNDPGNSSGTAMQQLAGDDGDGYGLKFPLFENPSDIFNLLMGKDIGLVEYDLKPFSFEFGYEQFFPIMGPLGVSIGGSVGVAIDLGFGYGTRGIREFIQSGARNIALLLDGFYFMDVQGDPAQDVPELKFWGEITAAAEVNLVVAEAGVKGGIFIEVNFDLNDPDRDGDVYLSELAGNFMNEWKWGDKVWAPLAIFDISGDLTVRLFAFIYVDLFFFSIDWEQDIVPEITLVDFAYSFGRHPVGATELDNGDLALNMGPQAGQRVHGDLNGDAGETIVVSGPLSNLTISAGGETHDGYSVKPGGKIVAKGAGGDDVIDLSGITEPIDCILEGGTGNDTLKAPAAGGHAILIGGDGDDHLFGGGGADYLYGGVGKDEIHGGAKRDIIFGDDGTITESGGVFTAVSSVGATDANDDLFGDEDEDVIFGGGGKDSADGGGNNDVIFGDGGTLVWTYGSINIQKVEGTEARKRGDADTLLAGGEGNDYIFGGVGDDTIDGGNGRDFLFGESGKDTMTGGGGDDDMFGDGWWLLASPPDANHPYRPASGGDADTMDGGADADRLWGGDGNDLMKGGDGGDYLYGGLGNDTMYGDLETHTLDAGADYVYGQGDADVLYGGDMGDTMDGGLGDDLVWGAYGPEDYTAFADTMKRVSAMLPDPGDPTTSLDKDKITWSAGIDLIDGQSGSDIYTIDFTGGTSIGRVYIFDSGVNASPDGVTPGDGTDNMKVNGTAYKDVFLLRGVDDGDRGLGFVAMLNVDEAKGADAQPVERADYDGVERIVVNGLLGNDKFFVDDVHAECTLNGGAGQDTFQLAQMYRSERIYDNVSGSTEGWVTPDYLAPVVADPFPRVGHGGYNYPGGDQYMTIETTRGFLSRGIRYPITMNGGPGNDFFSVFHNEAVANLNGEAGDDVFFIKAFALAGSQEPKRGRSDVSGGDGTDLVQYVVNAPVNIDGGDGFDRVIIVGTEFGDDLVITAQGVYGAGLNVNYVNIESLEVDGAEGNDRFYVQSTSEKFVTRISGGLGSDTFSMSGDVPPVISNDLLGHSGVITHSIETSSGEYTAGFKIEGISANIADDDEPGIRITETGGGTAVTEGSPAYDEYTIVLTREPTNVVTVRALVPSRSPTDEELDSWSFRLESTGVTPEDDGSLMFTFTSGNWDTERTIRVYGDGIVDDGAYENTRSGFINHTVMQPTGTFRGSVTSVETIEIPDYTVEYEPKVRYETTVGVDHDDFLDASPIPHPFVAHELIGALFEIVDGKGIGQRMLIKDNDADSVTLFGKFRPGRDPDSTSKYLIRRYQELALPSVLLTVYDNDAPDVAVTEVVFDDPNATDGITAVVEGGDADSGTPDKIKIALTKAPTVDVVIRLTNPDGQVTLGPSALGTLDLTFTTLNWATPQYVIVDAKEDGAREGFHHGLVLLEVLSGPGDTDGDKTDVYELTDTVEDPVYADAMAAGHVFSPEAFVGLSFNPKNGAVISVSTIEEGTTRTLDPSEYYVEGNLVIFVDSEGNPRMVKGKVTVIYKYVIPGYLRTGLDKLYIEPVLADVADNEVPGVIIRESGKSTDVIETSDHWFDGVPWTDTYTVSLAKQPADDVVIVITPQFTKSTRGKIRWDLPQVVALSAAPGSTLEWRDLANIRGVHFLIPVLLLKFTPTNWDVPQQVDVYAWQDDVVDGSDTQVFAPKLHTVADIQGPVYAEGAGGSGSLIDMNAKLLPGETNKKEPSWPLVSYSVDVETGIATAIVDRDEALDSADIEDNDINKLVNRTLEITSGPAIDQFRLIVAADPNPEDATQVVLTLNEPYKLLAGEVIDTSDPLNPTRYAVTRESLNFFVDETKSIDYMFVFDEDSVADSSGRIENLTTDGIFDGNGTVAEFVTKLSAKRLTGLQMGSDLTIGQYLQPGGITYGGLEVVEVNLGSGNNVFTIENTEYRQDFQTWTVVNTGAGDDHVTINLSRTRHARAAAAGSTENTLKFTGGAFTANAVKGFVLEITSGDLKGTRREIVANAADTLTLSDPWERDTEGALMMPQVGDTFELWFEDGPLAVNGQTGTDIIDGSGTTTVSLVLFGSEGNDTLKGGNARDIIFGDLGRVDYYNEDGKLVTRLGVDRAEKIGFITSASNLVTTPLDDPSVWTCTMTVTDMLGGVPFTGDWFDDDILIGTELQTVNGLGFGQFLFVLDYTSTTLTLRGNFDPVPFDPTPGAIASTWRIPILPEDQTDGVVRAPTLVMSRNRSVGGTDIIFGGGGDDLLIGGADTDAIAGDAGVTTNDGADVIVGDNGRMEFDLTGAPYDGDRDTLDRVVTLDPAFGALDVIMAGGDDDVVLAGTGGDVVLGEGDADLIFGDFAEVKFGTADVEMLGPAVHQVEYPLWARVIDDALGGADILHGGDGEDVMVGGAFADDIDGFAGDDLIFGDNVELNRSTPTLYNDFTNPRFRTVAGALYGTDPVTAHDDGLSLQDGTARNVPALTGTPVWGNWDFVLLYHDTANEAAPSSVFGGDYIAGGADDDQIFGQLGNDTIQGDGAIVSKYEDPAKVVGAYRDGTGLHIVATFEAVTDGDDYIEGNGGADVVFGGLGQDDIIGGNSKLFSLTTRDRRPDGADLLFGGAGGRATRNLYVGSEHGTVDDDEQIALVNRHARDADTIAGDNANLYRIVSLTAGPYGAISSYKEFNYDQTSAAEDRGALRIVPRAVEYLDYTPGGTDYVPTSVDIGAADEIHGESGDDAIYGFTGNDVLFGDSDDDDIVGGWGNDWISGGTGQDGVLGDDGRIATSRNSSSVGEPLHGITALLASDPDTRATNGNVLNEFIYTPGKIQTATINVAGVLKKTVNITPFNVQAITATITIQDPLFAPLKANDIIYGGLGGDFLHGGSGDDAVSGAEALSSFYAAPANPGNILGYGVKGDKKPAGEFAAYNEYDPWRKIAGFLLNFDQTEGPEVASTTWGTVNTDGDDAIFGDLGNDWLVGGTGKDDIYGGWGDDLLNADDNHDSTATGADPMANDIPDPHPSYEDRAYGGAGRDVLIGNTGGDRLIDWVGEFNSFVVPYAPFGIAAVSRTLQPQLPEFLLGLSAGDGADPTRAVDTGAAAIRNGEPEGELGMVIQKDDAWQDQTGGPTDPQAGNIPGGPRDVLRSASFNDGTAQGFSPDSGIWTLSSGRLEVSPGSAKLGGDAVSVFYVDSYLPRYYEVRATINAAKPIAGYKANAYLIFDYVSPTDFKFAGVDIATNQLVMGHRDANGWTTDVQRPAQLKPDTDYQVLLSVNGTYVTVVVNGTMSMAYSFTPRVDVDGYKHMLNEGMVGIGANMAKARIDNVVVQVLPPNITFSRTEAFSTSPVALLGSPESTGWSLTSDGRYAAASPAGIAMDLSLVSVGSAYLLAAETKFSVASGSAGFVFDCYGSGNFKFVTVSSTGQIAIGHYSTRTGWVIDASTTKAIVAGTDVTLGISLQGNVVTVTLNGSQVLTKTYYALVSDGALGLLASAGSASFDLLTIKTNDPEVVLTQ